MIWVKQILHMCMSRPCTFVDREQHPWGANQGRECQTCLQPLFRKPSTIGPESFGNLRGLRSASLCCFNARHGGVFFLPALPIHHRRASKLESVWANSPYITWTWNLFWHLREIPERKPTIWGDQPAVWSLCYLSSVVLEASRLSGAS